MQNIFVNPEKLPGVRAFVLEGGPLDGQDFPLVQAPYFPCWVDATERGPRYYPTSRRNADGLRIYSLEPMKGGAL